MLETFATLVEKVGHHLTVRFNSDDVAELPPVFGPNDVGRTFMLKVVGFARRADGGIEAVAVALMHQGNLVREGFTMNRVPHITVALTPGLAKPVDSNALLEAGFEEIDGPTLLAVLQHIAPQPPKPTT